LNLYYKAWNMFPWADMYKFECGQALYLPHVITTKKSLPSPTERIFYFMLFSIN